MNINGDTIYRLLDKRGAYPEECAAYGEPGYSDPEKGIIFANWNNVSRAVRDWLEHHGFSLEWCDEWVIDHETSKAYRSSPDSYSWKPSYFITEDGDIVGKDDIENGDCVNAYIEHLRDSTKRADTFNIDWTKHGFKKLNDDSYENGWHPGQDNEPKSILKEAQKALPEHEFIFSIDENSQFYSTFSIWARPIED